jgi:hypothetical protein
MKSNEISTRQLCFILAFFLPVCKLNVLPASLGGIAGNDLLLPALLVLLLQGAAIFALLWLMQKKPHTMPELLAEKCGSALSRAFFFILGIYFLFASLYPLLEEKVYVINTFYDTRPSLIVFLPFFLFSTYAASKGLTSIGRSADISLFLFLPSFLLLLVMATGSADFSALLPLGTAPASAIWQGCAAMLSCTAEAAYLLVFMGHVRVERHFLAKTMLSYAAGAVGVLYFLAVFYGIFSTVSTRELYALSKIARYYNALKTIGRVDYLFLYAIAIVQIFTVTLPVQLAVHSFAQAFRTDRLPFISVVINILLFVYLLLASDHFSVINNLVGKYLYPVYLVFAFALPLLSPLLALPNKLQNKLQNKLPNQRPDERRKM